MAEGCFWLSVFSPALADILLRAKGVILKVQNGSVSSSVWPGRRKSSSWSGPSRFCCETPGSWKQLCLESGPSACSHANSLCHTHPSLELVRGHTDPSASAEREQTLVKAETDAPGSTPSRHFPLLLKSNPKPSPQGSELC